jgi:hypothetical protein
VEDGVGVAVEGLPGQSKTVGTLSDLAMGSFENGGGVGDADLGG